MLSILRDLGIFWRLLLSLVILEFVMSRLGNKPITWVIAAFLIYVLVFQNFWITSFAYIAYWLLILGILWLVPDILFMGPFRRMWRYV